MQNPMFHPSVETTDALPSPMRPGAFCVRYIATEPAPYSFSCPQYPTSAGGVLRGGQAVWLESGKAWGKGANVKVFVDGLGLVALEARWLLRREA